MKSTKSFLIPPGFASACPHPSHPTLGVVASYLHPCSLVSIIVGFFSGVIPLRLRMSSLFFGHVACGILVPQPGIKPMHWKLWVFTTGWPEKSHVFSLWTFPGIHRPHGHICSHALNFTQARLRSSIMAKTWNSKLSYLDNFWNTKLSYFHHKRKKCNDVCWCMLTRLIVVIYFPMHANIMSYVVCLKLIQYIWLLYLKRKQNNYPSPTPYCQCS